MGLKDGFILGDWVVHPMQGTFAAFLGRLDEAIAAFETALRLNPKFRGIHSLFANVREDSRWNPFLASIDMSPDTLNQIAFAVELPEG